MYKYDENEKYILNCFDKWLKETGAAGMESEYVARFNNEFIVIGDFEGYKITISFEKDEFN